MRHFFGFRRKQRLRIRDYDTEIGSLLERNECNSAIQQQELSSNSFSSGIVGKIGKRRTEPR